MIHGRCREEVQKQLKGIIKQHSLDRYNYQVLFSVKAYKQCGGQYIDDESICAAELNQANDH